MKKRIRVIISLLIAIVCLLIPSVVAYMIKQQEISNQFDEGRVTCEVVEQYKTVTVEVDGKQVQKQFETNKESICIKNTGNYPAYIRLRLVTYIADTKGVPVGKNSVLKNLSIRWNDNQGNANWIYKNETQSYYYTKVLQPGESTENLLASNLILEQYNEDYDGIPYYYNQVLEVHAEAIQSLPAEAIEDSWGVFVDETTGRLSLTE